MDNKVEEIGRKVITAIEQENLKPFTLAIFKSNRPCDEWSYLNRLAIALEGTQDARGFEQWKKAERHVKRETKAIYILAPITAKKTIEDEDTGKDKVITIVKGFKGIPVYKVEDTEGKPLETTELPDSVPVVFDGLIEKLGIKVSYDTYHGQAYGYFSPRWQEIKVMSPEVRVLLHELSHAVDHKTGEYQKSDYDAGEFVAELSSAILCNLLGYESDLGKVKSYLSSYGYDKVSESISLINRTLKVVEYIADEVRGK